MASLRQYLPHNLSSSAAAVLLMVVATLLTSIGMASNKYMVLNDLSPPLIVFWRSVFSFIPLIFLVRKQGGISTLKTPQPLLLMVRGAMGFLCMLTYCWSLEYLTLFSAESLLHLEPILVFVLAIIFLKEKFHKSSLLALIVAAIGVYTIVLPGEDTLSAGGVLGIAAAVFYALEIILTRSCAKHNTAITMFVYYTVMCLVGSGLALGIQGFVWPDPSQYVGFAFIALVNLGINLAFTEALRRAPASQLAPLEYLTLAWVSLWQIQIWGELPSLHVVLGAVLILVSGLWILKRSLHINKALPQ